MPTASDPPGRKVITFLMTLQGVICNFAADNCSYDFKPRQKLKWVKNETQKKPPPAATGSGFDRCLPSRGHSPYARLLYLLWAGFDKCTRRRFFRGKKNEHGPMDRERRALADQRAAGWAPPELLQLHTGA